MSTVILGSYFSKKRHSNDANDHHVIGRLPNGHVLNDDFSYIEKWYDSIHKNNLNAVLFHDNLSEDKVEKYQTDKIKFIRTEVNHHNNQDYRFFCFRDFLEKNHFDCVFHTDVSDVVVVKDPEQLLRDFPEHSYFFCKDSIKLSQFPYLQWHKAFSFEDSMKFMLNQKRWDLINVGVGGGSFDSMKKFYNEYCKIREPLGNFDINFDMWIPQYLLRSYFDDKFILGEPVCSEFKKYEEKRDDVYFIHK